MNFLAFLNENSPDISTALVGTYNLTLVIASVLVAAFASYAALLHGERAFISQQRSTQSIWTATGAVVMGLGIWVVHSIGMLGFHLPLEMSFDPFLTFLSFVPALGAGWAVLDIAQRPKVSALRLVTCSLLLGFGIVAVYIICMAAMRAPVQMLYDPMSLTLSIVAAVALSLFALSIKFIFARLGLKAKSLHTNLLTALLMGAAIAAMHYEAMRGTFFFPLAEPMKAVSAAGISPDLVATASVLIVLALAVQAMSAVRIDRTSSENTELIRRLERTETIAKVGGWEMDREKGPTNWTPETYAIHDLDPADHAAFEEYTTHLRAHLSPHHAAAMQAAMDHGTPYDLEFSRITAKGRKIWLYSHGEAIYSKGKIVGLAGHLQDITARKQAEESLGLLKRLENAEGEAGIGGWEYDFKSDTTTWTAGLYAIHELDPLDHAAFEIYVRQNLAGGHRPAIDAAAAGGPPFRTEIRSINAKGREIWVQTYGEAVFEDGKFVGLIGHVQDITARKKTEALLRSQREDLARHETNLRALLNNSPVGIWLIEDGRLDYVNPHLRQLTGYTAKELTQMSFSELLHPKSQAISRDRYARRMAGEDVPGPIELVMLTKDGRSIDIEVTSTKTHWDGRSFSLTFVTDITARKKVEAQLGDIARI